MSGHRAVGCVRARFGVKVRVLATEVLLGVLLGWIQIWRAHDDAAAEVFAFWLGGIAERVGFVLL